MTVWRTADPSARLTDPDEPLPPRETGCAEAQRAANFVVFEPGWLPGDCTVTAVTVRPEQPPGRPGDTSAGDIGQTPHSEGNPCSVRIVVSGDGRRLRIKEFLYDWAPPAASVAPLWGTPEPTPFECGAAVGWLGTDYKDRRGACVQRDRTQIELSVSEGAFDDEELQRVLDGLEPADVETGRPVRTVPFHRLNYWVRYQYRPPVVPNGLWAHAPERPYDRSYRLSPSALRDRPPVSPLLPAGERFVLDSAVSFPDDDAIECVFRNRENGSDHLWLIGAPAGSSLAPSLPLDPSDQPADTRRTVELRGTTVQYAALTEEYGAWEAIWAEDGVRYALWAGASRSLTGDGFRAVVEGLETPAASGSTTA